MGNGSVKAPRVLTSVLPTDSTSTSIPTSSTAQFTKLHALPGAYQVPGQTRSQRFTVTVPPGVSAGQPFPAFFKEERLIVQCPDDALPGDQFVVTTESHIVKIPPNVKPGQQFRVMIKDREVVVTCPKGVQPGQRTICQVPIQVEKPRLPNHKTYKFRVPDDVHPGESFTLRAHGRSVSVDYRANMRPGQTILLQLPVFATEEEIQAVRIHYNKDGWIRYLGTDLKFYWNLNNESHAVVPFDSEENVETCNYAFVRELTVDKNGNKDSIVCISADKYAAETTVEGTSINSSELARIAKLSFQEKVDWLRRKLTRLQIPFDEGYIQLKLRPNFFSQDLIDCVGKLPVDEIRKIFTFQLIDEVTLKETEVESKEFYGMLSQQDLIKEVKSNLFITSPLDAVIPTSTSTVERDAVDVKLIFTLGRIFGKALTDGCLIPLRLIKPIYKHLLGWPLTMNDIQYIDHQTYHNLIELLQSKDISSKIKSFTIGLPDNQELSLDGKNGRNKTDAFIEAQCRYFLLLRMEKELFEFLKGFYEVIPEPLLTIFDYEELELLLHGHN